MSLGGVAYKNNSRNFKKRRLSAWPKALQRLHANASVATQKYVRMFEVKEKIF
jgi:hypothetical protein